MASTMTMSPPPVDTISRKAQGKKRQADAVEPDGLSSSSKGADVQTRQKRVLPTRARRGGPGIGSTDVDQMILDAQLRRFEDRPLVPAETKFVLTTNSGLLPSSSTSEEFTVELNSTAYGRYFDRPEVIEACRAQATIQTPTFRNLSDDATVGGRFRPRGTQEESVDTSDAAYEKRHRKYETFEKRQRLREKEKLKHEHYKLKERIEQLRGMDVTAFLALPASCFSAAPAQYDEDLPEDFVGLPPIPGNHVNTATAYHEGQRRKKEMLEIAAGVEERYRVLLPPDRPHKYKEKAAAAKEASISAAPVEADMHHLERTESKKARRDGSARREDSVKRDSLSAVLKAEKKKAEPRKKPPKRAERPQSPKKAQLVVEEPAVESPAVSEPLATPIVDEEILPVAEPPVAEPPVAVSPTVERPSEEPPAEEPPAAEPLAEEPLAAEPPAIELPAIELPAAESPAEEPNGVVEPEPEPEMEAPPIETMAVSYHIHDDDGESEYDPDEAPKPAPAKAKAKGKAKAKAKDKDKANGKTKVTLRMPQEDSHEDSRPSTPVEGPSHLLRRRRKSTTISAPPRVRESSYNSRGQQVARGEAQRGPDGRFMSIEERQALAPPQLEAETESDVVGEHGALESASAPAPRKRRRGELAEPRATSRAGSESVSVHRGRAHGPGCLVTEANRKALARSERFNGRLPFGARLPARVEASFDFNFPEWLLLSADEEEDDELEADQGEGEMDVDVDVDGPGTVEMESASVGRATPGEDADMSLDGPAQGALLADPMDDH